MGDSLTATFSDGTTQTINPNSPNIGAPVTGGPLVSTSASLGSGGAPFGIDTGGTGGVAGTGDGSTGIPGVSSQGTGNFYSMSSTPAASSDVPGKTTNPIQPNAASGSGASAGTAPQGTDKSSAGGTPIYETNAAAVGADAANTVSKALGGVTQGAAADTQAATSAGTSWLNSLFGEGTDLLARGGFILLGLFLLLGAFVFFYIDSKSSGSSNVEVVPV